MTHLHRRAGLATLALALLAPLAAAAQDYPSKPLRLIAPFPTGTGPDANTREIAAELAKVLGQPVVVENKPGASTMIGMAGSKPWNASIVQHSSGFPFTSMNCLGMGPPMRLPEPPATMMVERCMECRYRRGAKAQ